MSRLSANPSGLIEYVLIKRRRTWKLRYWRRFQHLWPSPLRCLFFGIRPILKGFGAIMSSQCTQKLLSLKMQHNLCQCGYLCGHCVGFVWLLWQAFWRLGSSLHNWMQSQGLHSSSACLSPTTSHLTSTCLHHSLSHGSAFRSSIATRRCWIRCHSLTWEMPSVQLKVTERSLKNKSYNSLMKLWSPPCRCVFVTLRQSTSQISKCLFQPKRWMRSVTLLATLPKKKC